MIRNTFFAVLAVLAVAATSQAGVMINSVQSASALAGHSVWTLTAVSDNAAEPILGFDFSGDPDNNDPATGLGFFGAMSQVNPAGSATVYQDSNSFFPLVGRNVNEDSQFLFATTNPALVVSAPASQEGPNILQGTFAFADPAGLSVPFVQLVIPDAATGSVSYRGDVLVGQSGLGFNVRLEGMVGGDIVVDPPVVDDLALFNDVASSIVGGTVTGTDVDTWDGTLTFLDYTPNYGAPGGAPGLNLAATWNPATQAFSWDTTGSNRGDYRWEVSGSNGGGSDTGTISVANRVVPEPATLSLLGLALVGLVGVARKRS